MARTRLTRRRSPSWESPPRRRVEHRGARDSRSPPVRHRRRRRRLRRDYDSRAASYDSFGSQADFDSRSRSPRGRGGVNAIPLGRYEPPETEARVWILHSDAAKVIGRSGRALREIENRTSTRIQVSKEEDMDAETKERSVDIVGRREDQDAALDLICEKVLYCRQDGGDVIKDVRGSNQESKGDLQRVITVLPEEVGKVLGRKGETVRVIESESGAKVELNKAEGKVEIFGKPEEQERAVELLLAEVHFAKDAEGNVLKDEPRPKQRTGNEPELPPPLKLWVKDREAGKVIGRGGETVREVMEKSHADIKVQKADEMAPGTKERQIKVIGTKEQQDTALQLILEEVTWAKGIEGMLKGVAVTDAEKAPPPVEEEKEKETEKEKEKEQPKEEKKKGGGDGADPAAKVKPRRFRETARELNRPKSGPVRWVCATCGGDHRTKSCPHATGMLSVGVQSGMQMGLQAMGLPAPGLMPGLPPMLPPGMPPMPGMPHMGIPGMPPLLPGMKVPGMPSSGSSSGSSSSSASDPDDPGHGASGRGTCRRKVRREGRTLRRRRREPRAPEPALAIEAPPRKKIVMSDL